MLLTMKTKKKSLKKKGAGYYLALDSCPPGGLSTVKGYDDCCPPMFSGSLSGLSNSSNWDPLCNNPVQIGTSRKKYRKSKKYNRRKFKKKNKKLSSKRRNKKKNKKTNKINYLRRLF